MKAISKSENGELNFGSRVQTETLPGNLKVISEFGVELVELDFCQEFIQPFLTFIFSHCVIFSRFLTIKYMHTSHYLVMWHWWTFIQINYKVIQLISFVTTSNTCVNEDERKFIKNSGKNQIEWESEWFYCCSSRHCYQKILNMLLTMIHTRKKPTSVA